MAKIDNSGYILVDFSKVDHNKRTQVIDGFYSDCEKLISNEKFVLLSNVNEVSTTPIPSIVLFKNSIYNVITFEYVYTISAGDVVVVTKNEGGITVDVIDDSIIALNKTWSSSKINEMLPDNAGQITYDNTVSHLQSNRVQSAIDELVTIVNGVDSRVTITETDISNIKNQLITIGNELSLLHDSNNIIYEGVTTVNEAITALDNNKQDILTAGNNISIVNDVISAVDTTYSAGNNVSISSENVISATDTTYGAGAGLSLTGNVFSVDPSTAGIEAADVEYSSGVSVADKIDEMTDYSTNEKAVGKWIDGSILYQKTVYCGNMPNNTSINVDTQISNLARVIELKGTCYNSNTGSVLPLPMIGSNNYLSLSMLGTNISIGSNVDRSGYTGYVTLTYLKSV